jgi:hypothetical protein
MMMRVLSATLAVDGCMPMSWRKEVAEDMIDGFVGGILAGESCI